METTDGTPLLGSTGSNLFGSSETTLIVEHWGTPNRISVEEVGESIEMVFEQTLSYIGYYATQPETRRVYKIIYSCVDGKWNKSEPVFGRIVPAQCEKFCFDECQSE